MRNRQIRNFLLLTLFATGTPMLLMGDEIRRSQRGNNNAYCLDDESAWFDWSAIEQHAELHGFTKRLIALRKARMLPLECDLTLNELIARHRIDWHGITLGAPDCSVRGAIASVGGAMRQLCVAKASSCNRARSWYSSRVSNPRPDALQ